MDSCAETHHHTYTVSVSLVMKSHLTPVLVVQLFCRGGLGFVGISIFRVSTFKVLNLEIPLLSIYFRFRFILLFIFDLAFLDLFIGVCLHVCLCTQSCAVPTEARRRLWIPHKWSYEWLSVTT